MEENHKEKDHRRQEKGRDTENLANAKTNDKEEEREDYAKLGCAKLKTKSQRIKDTKL